MKNIKHYNFVIPDIATIKYIDNNKIHTTYYDYGSKKYSNESETEIAVYWSDSELSKKISKPDAPVIKLSFDRDDIFWVEAYGITLEQFNEYASECKAKGFDIDPYKSESLYTADNSDGLHLYLSYDDRDNSMDIRIQVPEK